MVHGGNCSGQVHGAGGGLKNTLDINQDWNRCNRNQYTTTHLVTAEALSLGNLHSENKLTEFGNMGCGMLEG